METLILRAKTKSQLKTIKAVAGALNIEYRSVDEEEDRALGKLMENTKGDFMTPSQQAEFEKIIFSHLEE